ncbi:hypothetical protein PAMA_005950 [Pampus argenteus]
MYRFIFRTVYTARASSVSIYESRLLLAKCDVAAAPVFRFANGGEAKALSTSSFRLCEKKENVDPSTQDEKTNLGKEGEPTETPTDGDSKVIKMDEQREEPEVLKADVINRQDVVIQQTTDAAENGKKNLLNLLGSMKMEVTNKRKVKQSTSRSKAGAMESTISMFQKATMETSSQSENLDPELVAAASAAASTLPNRDQAESELLKQLRQHDSITESQKKGDINKLGVIIADMKVGKKKKKQQSNRAANQVHFDVDDEHGYTYDREITAELRSLQKRRNLFLTKRLNIFSTTTTDEDGVDSAAVRPTIWDMDFAYRVSSAADIRPSNAFEEMIKWTKEGKMWQYPINNEAGLEEEASVPFHEHVFLEKHLEEGFPRQGPVRHFMELVLAGLCRNPYLTVQQKKEHISWFRDYFHQKANVLKEADVVLN